MDRLPLVFVLTSRRYHIATVIFLFFFFCVKVTRNKYMLSPNSRNTQKTDIDSVCGFSRLVFCHALCNAEVTTVTTLSFVFTFFYFSYSFIETR